MSRMKPPVVVWPEGQPERAVLCRTWLGAQWRLLGPAALLSMRRMTSAGPVTDENKSPSVIAKNVEVLRALRKWAA